jgi:hypothetical protein
MGWQWFGDDNQFIHLLLCVLYNRPLADSMAYSKPSVTIYEGLRCCLIILYSL